MQQSKIIGIILTTAVSMIVATSIVSSNIQLVYADANCDKAGPERNTAGNFKGNAKQCGITPDGPKEPIRKCDSPNGSKDNDGDGVSGCKERGSKY